MSVTERVPPRSPRAPKNLEQATALLEQVARLDAEVVTTNANRDAAIAATNAVADALLTPVLERRAVIADLIKPWWLAHREQLLPKGRKTMVLGGCTIGCKAGSVSLTFAGGDDKVAAGLLHQERWSKDYTKVTLSVDKTAVKKALTGARGDSLRALGFGTSAPVEVFVLEAVKQLGTVG